MAEIQITRRIDDLGRVVIPKEIRRNLHLKDGAEMSFFVDDNRLILTKYSTLKSNFDMASDIINSIKDLTGDDVIITDNDNIIVKNYDEIVEFSNALLDIYNNRKTIVLTGNDLIYKRSNYEIIVPLVFCGDVVGGIVTFSKNADEKRLKMLKLFGDILVSSLQ